MIDNGVSEGFGIVHFGKVTSYGKWMILDGQLQISFETRSLSLDKQRDLEHYRNCLTPLRVQLPGERKSKKGVVIGFERNERIATFFLREAKEAVTAASC